jgi:hypothetical protein
VNKRELATGLFGLLVCLSACDFNIAPKDATPTVQILPTASLTLAPTVSPTAEATLTPAPQVVLESPTPTATLAPPTLTPTVTETPGPYEHTLKEGETLGYIVQLYGYTDLSVGAGGIIDQIVALNDSIPNADILPPPGAVIIIPRQTPTPPPQNAATAAADQATMEASTPNVVLPANTTINQYVVQPNDTIIGIAQENNVTLEQIAVLNPDLDFFSCNFEFPGGGPGCNVPLVVGQSINLPAPTPTPTLSPTPSGNETPTATPTYAPPLLVFPPQSASAPAGVFTLQWVSVGVLLPTEFYLVEVTDTVTSQVFRGITQNTSFQLPDSLIPTDGQSHVMNWTVRVVTKNEQGIYRQVGGNPEIRTFTWASR